MGGSNGITAWVAMATAALSIATIHPRIYGNPILDGDPSLATQLPDGFTDEPHGLTGNNGVGTGFLGSTRNRFERPATYGTPAPSQPARSPSNVLISRAGTTGGNLKNRSGQMNPAHGRFDRGHRLGFRRARSADLPNATMIDSFNVKNKPVWTPKPGIGTCQTFMVDFRQSDWLKTHRQEPEADLAATLGNLDWSDVRIQQKNTANEQAAQTDQPAFFFEPASIAFLEQLA